MPERDGAACDPADVDQIVDEPDQMERAGDRSWCTPAGLGSSKPPDSFSASSALRTGASGPRNSCASIARNSSLRRSASSRQVGLGSLLAVHDVPRDFDAPTTSPPSSRIGEMVRETCDGLPVLAQAAPSRNDRRARRIEIRAMMASSSRAPIGWNHERDVPPMASCRGVAEEALGAACSRFESSPSSDLLTMASSDDSTMEASEPRGSQPLPLRHSVAGGRRHRGR